MRLTVVGVLFALASCEPQSDGAIGEATNTIKQSSFDPDAARFREVRESGHFVCGDVNLKNRFGGYIGFVPFSYDPKTKDIRVADTGLEGGRYALHEACFTDEDRRVKEATTNVDMNSL